MGLPRFHFAHLLLNLFSKKTDNDVHDISVDEQQDPLSATPLFKQNYASSQMGGRMSMSTSPRGLPMQPRRAPSSTSQS